MTTVVQVDLEEYKKYAEAAMLSDDYYRALLPKPLLNWFLNDCCVPAPLLQVYAIYVNNGCDISSTIRVLMFHHNNVRVKNYGTSHPITTSQLKNRRVK